jgi:hypothetical protein
MSTSLACKSKSSRCQSFCSADLGETIEHLRRDHQPSNIKRPQALGVSDSHGHVWYCHACKGKLGQDHRSYDSDQAMWDHVNQCHEHWLEDFYPSDDSSELWYAVNGFRVL